MNGLLDFLQSASNAAASNVSGPVDLINWLLGRVGVPTSEAPVGGSKWMEQKGLTRPVQQGAASVAGETAGLLAPFAAAAKAPQIAAGLLKAGENYAASGMGPVMRQRGAIVWHGSPHKFDKFDSSKIGTGEGAQAYGHGLYLADSPSVAGNYANVLPKRLDTPEFWEGKPLPKALSAQEFDELGSLAREMMKAGMLPQAKMDRWRELHDVRTAYDAAIEAQRPASQLYKVDLPDTAIAKMLDWDKPLSQQPEAVKKALGKLPPETWALRDPLGELAPQYGEAFGHEIYQKAGRGGARNPPSLDGSPGRGPPSKFDPTEAAKFLQELGIPGIRYLDGGSRGAGAGTSNYVVFPGEEGLLTILERNGQPIGLLR